MIGNDSPGRRPKCIECINLSKETGCHSNVTRPQSCPCMNECGQRIVAHDEMGGYGRQKIDREGGGVLCVRVCVSLSLSLPACLSVSLSLSLSFSFSRACSLSHSHTLCDMYVRACAWVRT